MMKKRVEIEEAENGFTVKCWGHEEEESDEKTDMGYYDAKTSIAKDLTEAMSVAEKLFKGK